MVWAIGIAAVGLGLIWLVLGLVHASQVLSGATLLSGDDAAAGLRGADAGDGGMRVLQVLPPLA